MPTMWIAPSVRGISMGGLVSIRPVHKPQRPTSEPRGMFWGGRVYASSRAPLSLLTAITP
jgi:hypothetical protein